MFDPKHLAGASSDLVRSMVKVGRKAAELEPVKLQTEIIKEQSELRRKRLEKRVKMASGKGTKGTRMKSPKQEEEDDDFLEDLVVDSDPKKSATYSTLKPGGFVTKAEDQKGRLGKRQAKNETTKDDDNNNNNNNIYSPVFYKESCKLLSFIFCFKNRERVHLEVSVLFTLVMGDLRYNKTYLQNKL